MTKFYTSARENLLIFLLMGSAILFILGILSVIALYEVNFDEAYNLQLPTNLVEFGVYASRTLDGFKWFDPYISTGPLVLFPVAISYTVLGKGIVQARLISAIYAFAVLIVLFLTNKRFFGFPIAVMSLFLLNILRNVYYILGIVLGEGAGIGFVLLGLLFWSYTEEKRQLYFALLAGLFWGLSTWAKSSMLMAVLFLMGSLGAYILLRKPADILFLASTTVVSATLAISWFLAPSIVASTYLRSYSQIQETGLIWQQFNTAVAQNVVRNFPGLTQSLGLPILLGAPLGLQIVRTETKLPSTKLALCTMPIAWILWWLLYNDHANYRHLFPALIFGIPLLSNMLVKTGTSAIPKSIQVVLIGLVFMNIFIGGGIVSHFTKLHEARVRRTAQAQFARYVAQLDNGTQVMGVGWFMAWDISFLSQRPFGDLESEEVLLNPKTYYVIITPTIRHFPEAYHHALGIMAKYSWTVIYEDDVGYSLYKLEQQHLE